MQFGATLDLAKFEDKITLGSACSYPKFANSAIDVLKPSPRIGEALLLAIST